MNLLVTGGCGFIGSNFVRQRLTEKNSRLAKLVNLDALTYAGNPANLADLAGDPRYAFVKGDIGDSALVSRLLAEHQIDAVVNFAAESHVDRSIDSPEPFVQTNVVGTLRLLNCTRLHWSKLAEPKKSAFRFLHVST
ncbi:MAG: GDP-mannose 4,6-dehydratase, partial [Opitutaceae bacterium]